MNSKIRLSVIIPVYNVEKYIDRCINSVVNQNFDGLQVLLIDDGSTDSSGKKCDAFQNEYDFITAYHKPNGGLSDARNYGFERAKGEYVLFFDSDDYLAENALNCLYGETASNPDVVIGFSNVLKPSKSMERFEKIAKDIFDCHRIYSGKEYLAGCLEGGALRIEVQRSIYRRDFLEKNNLYFKKGILHEDEHFTPRVLLKAEKVVLSDYAFYFYDNTRSGSIMNSTKNSEKKMKDRFMIYDELIEIYKNVTPKRLKKLLLDDISWKYIDCYCAYYSFAKKIKPKRFKLIFMACKKKRIIKALLFSISPRLFILLQGR